MTEEELWALPRTRKAALEGGVNSYFTGKPCKRGHSAPRRCGSRGCVECSRAILSEWRVTNPEKYAAQGRRYRDKNPEKVRGSFKKWWAANRDKLQVRRKEWRDRNPEVVRARKAAWRLGNPEKARRLDVRRLISRSKGPPTKSSTIPDNVVELKTLQLQIKRYLKEMK